MDSDQINQLRLNEQEQNQDLGNFDFSRITRQTAVGEPEFGEEDEEPMPPAPRVDYTDINGGKKSRRRRRLTRRRRSTHRRSTRRRSVYRRRRSSSC